MARIVAVIALLCLAAVGVWPPQPNPRADKTNHPSEPEPPTAITFIHNQESARAPEHTFDAQTYWFRRPEWWLVAVASFTLGVIWYQAREMVRATEAMRESTEAVKSQTDILSDTARRQLRAYVVLESGRVVNVANPIPAFEGQVIQPTGAEITNLACGPVAFVQIKNAGQTPAYRVAHWGGICFREYPLVSPLPAKDAQLPPMPSVLGPGIGGSKMLFLNQLSSQQIADLRDGTGAIYIYGEITYIDAFEVERFTRYRAMHHRIGGVIGVSTDLSHTEEGNEAN